ncbi:MAG: hypothetical protein JNK89_09525 [Saprospiraceae bacterium]|nr:hypothetical protein [Saprospiraceae bacterium]
METPGGAVAAIRAILVSSITPGPLGIGPTKPKAAAPAETASRASSGLLMQQIFTLGFVTDSRDLNLKKLSFA